MQHSCEDAKVVRAALKLIVHAMGLFTDDGTLGKGGVLRTGEHVRETERLALRLLRRPS